MYAHTLLHYEDEHKCNMFLTRIIFAFLLRSRNLTTFMILFLPRFWVFTFRLSGGKKEISFSSPVNSALTEAKDNYNRLSNEKSRRGSRDKKGGENTFHIGFIWTNPIQIALMEIFVEEGL